MNNEYFEIELPGLKLYNDLKKIKIKKITPFIHKKLLSLYNIEPDASLLLEFINDLLIDFDIKDLYMDDLSYLLYQIRLNCYSMIPLELEMECPDCGKITKVTLDPTKLDIKECDAFPTVELENFGTVSLRFRKVGDDLQIDKMLVDKQLDKDDIFYRTLAVDTLALDQWKPVEEVWKMMETGEITTQDTLKIEDILMKSSFGVEEKITYECKHCHKEVAQDYSLNLGDYFPATLN